LHCQEKKGKFKGYPTDFLNRYDFDTIVGCGPKAMLKSLKDYSVKMIKSFMLFMKR